MTSAAVAEPQRYLETQIRWRPVEIAFWLATLLPFVLTPNYLVLASQIAITALFALSLDLILGYAGIVSLGHAAYFGFGSYTAGLIAKWGWGEPLTGLVIAAAAAGVLGYLTSFIIARFRHLALIMITLGLGLLLAEAANSASWLTGGADGLQGVRMWKLFGVFQFDLYGTTAYTYALAVLFVCFLVARRLINSPFGLALRGIRENAIRMPAIGAPTRAHIRKVYTIAAVMAERRRADLAVLSAHRHAQARQRRDLSRSRRDHDAQARGARQMRPRAHLSDQHIVPPPQRARGGDARGVRTAGLRRQLVGEAARLWRCDRGGVCDPAVAAARRELLSADPRARLWPAAAVGDCARSRHQAEGAAARRAGGRRAAARERRAVLGHRRPLAGDRGAVHRARHERRVPFCASHHRDGCGTDSAAGYAQGNRRRCARARGLPGSRAPWLRRCSRSTTCAPVTATPSCSTVSRSTSPPAAASPCSDATASASRRSSSPSWASPASAAAPSSGAGATSRGLPRIGARAPALAGWRRSAKSFPRSVLRKTSWSGRDRGGGTSRRSMACFRV